MTYKVCVSHDAYLELHGRVFDLDDPDQVEEYQDYVFDCICFETIINLEQGEQFTITCIERDD